MTALLAALRQVLTERDNRTHDIVRWAAALGCLEFIILAAYDVMAQHREFHPQDYGIGLGGLLAGVGTALRVKSATELPSTAPDPSKESP